MRILAALLAFLVGVLPALAFSDVPTSSPQNNAIEYMETKGVGKGSEKFYPKRIATRAEAVAFGVLSTGIEKSLLPVRPQTRFTDVAPDAWYAPYIAYADRMGALFLFTGKEFEPSKRVTKAEAAVLGVEITGTAIDPSIMAEQFGFTDMRRQHRLALHVFTALKIGAIEARNDKSIGVHDLMTRGDMAQLYYELQISKMRMVVQLGGTPDGMDIDKFRAVWDEVKRSYLFQENIDEEKMMEGAIKGMVGSLGDPYTVFMSPEENAAFTGSLSGDVEGIGAYLAQDKDTKEIRVVAPIEGSPAEKAGILAGDVLVEVDGVAVVGKTVDEVAALIKGAAGTSVKLKLTRGGAVQNITVMRAKVTIRSVQVEYKNEIAVISVNQFGMTTDSEFAAVVREVQNMRVRGIILDMRNNPGGLLNTAIAMLSYFLPEGSVAAYAEYREGVAMEEYRTVGTPAFDEAVPVVVLINKGSASAAEVVTAALQDTGRATVIGEKSFGKGTVQQVLFFLDGSSLKITIAHWLSPKKQAIDHNGITPDITVIDRADTTQDEILERALDELNK